MMRTNHDKLTRAVLLGMTAFFLSVTSVAAAGGLTPHDVARLQEVREVAIAPGGGDVAYTLNVPRVPGEGENGPAWSELHVVGEDGETTPYVSGEVNVGDVAWTPDGSRITFLAKRGDDEHKRLYAIALQGGEARPIAELAADVDDYEICADGRRVVLVGREAEPEERKELAEQGFNQEVYEEGLRPSRVFVATLEDDGPAFPKEPLDVDGSVLTARWNPGCNRLALKVAPTPLVDDRLMKSRIHVVDAASGEVLAKVENPGKLGDFAWSPDGRQLAMIAAADVHDPREGRLMVVDATDGGTPRDLVPGLLAHVVDFAWRHGRLVFLVHQGVEAWLGEIGRDGESQATLLEPGGPIFSHLSLARNGEAALAGSTPSHPEEAFRLAAGAARAERLTDSNPWLAERRLASQEVVRYAARDGLELEGLLIRPLDGGDGPHPTILVVHGGPEAHFSNGWLTTYSRPGQTGAARGFAVFYPNYRASTGRGVEFSKLDHGDPAGKEFDDLVDGVDHLVDAGITLRDKVAITGGSYGGYATAWGATYYSERFAAAVTASGMSTHVAKFGTSDITNELYLVHTRMYPWDDFQLHLERSPVYHAEKARTPILILHGEDDARVYPGQALTLYRFLKVIGKTPVRLVLYPGEGHGNRKAAARLDFSLRQLRWIEHYLLGPGGEPPPYELDYTPDDREPEDM